MNFLEMIKSNKSFKRPHWDKWVTLSACPFLTKEDLLAEDWLIEPSLIEGNKTESTIPNNVIRFPIERCRRKV